MLCSLCIRLVQFFEGLSNRAFRFRARQAMPPLTPAVIPVVDKARSLDGLGYGIGCVTCQEQVVPRLYSPSEAHEDHGVDCEGGCHGTGYEFFIFAQICDSSQGKTEVGHGSPEMSAEKVLAGRWRPESRDTKYLH